MNSNANSNPSFIFTVMCPDAVGIVAAVSSALAQHGGLITEAQHYREPASASSILRIAFQASDRAPLDLSRLSRDFIMVADKFRMAWKIHDASVKPKLLVAVSKQGHCLKSLLHR